MVSNEPIHLISTEFLFIYIFFNFFSNHLFIFIHIKYKIEVNFKMENGKYAIDLIKLIQIIDISLIIKQKLLYRACELVLLIA